MKVPLIYGSNYYILSENHFVLFVLFLDSGPTRWEAWDSHLLEKFALRLHINTKQGWGITDALIQEVRSYQDKIFPGWQRSRPGRSQQIP